MMSTCSSSVSSLSPRRPNRSYLHKKRKLSKQEPLDVFTVLLNPIISQIISYLNNLSNEISNPPSIKSTPAKSEYILSFPINNEENECNNETLSLSGSSFLHFDKEEDSQITNEFINLMEESVFDNLIYNKMLCSSKIDTNDLTDYTEHLDMSKINCELSIDEITSKITELLKRIASIVKKMNEDKIASSSLFKFEQKSYYIIGQDMKDIIVKLAETYDMFFLSRVFGVSKKSIGRWKKTGTIRKKGAGRKIVDPEMEKKLLKWYNENKGKNELKLTSKVIREKAREFSTVKYFIASKGWYEKFKRNHGIIPYSKLSLEKKLIKRL